MTILCSCVLSIVQDTRIPGTERGGKKGGCTASRRAEAQATEPIESRGARVCW